MHVRYLSSIAVLLFASSLNFASASSFTQPIRFVVPFSAGGATDVLARLIAPKISERLGQPVYIENKAGANGQIGAQAVKAAPPDGSMILITTEHPVSILPFVTENVPYDAEKDFTILGKIANLQWTFSAPNSMGATTVSEFVEAVRKAPEKGNYGVPSDGGVPQMIGAVIAKQGNIDMTVIPYAGAAPMMPQLLGGHIGSGVAGVPEAVSMKATGKVNVLGISGLNRSAHLSDVPTFKEQGYNGLEVDSWFGAFAPKALPEKLAREFHEALQYALSDKDVLKKINDMSIEALPMSLEDASKEFKENIQFWRQTYSSQR